MPEIINPNEDRSAIARMDLTAPNVFPLFFSEVNFEKFRHIENLTVTFQSPISVITGTNRTGKTTILHTIACSHYNFSRRNVANGEMERVTWGKFMKFTSADEQDEDWSYHVKFKEGANNQERRGQRKAITNKWNGVAKKESQIGNDANGRRVYLIDLERIIPARCLSNSTYLKAKNHVANALVDIKKDYLSYILEEEYEVGSIIKVGDKEIFKYNNQHTYSSYNTASGEDVLTRIISDIVDAENKSLILIEEIEIGLHPKVQRRLMDILYHEAKKHQKQFIITTHSSSILSAVEPISRVFIQNNNGKFRSISGISLNAALCKMDAKAYPLLNVFVEDPLSVKIVNKILNHINNNLLILGFSSLINIIEVGDAEKTYNYYIAHKETYQKKKIQCGAACVLDGDMRNLRYRGKLKYPAEDGLFFIYSNDAPEKFLLRSYLITSPNLRMTYHLQNSNCHILFNKMVDEHLCLNEDEAFDLCWTEFALTDDGQQFIEEYANFLIGRCRYYSPDL